MSKGMWAMRKASQAYQVAKAVKALVNVERKFNIVATTHNPNSTTWNLSLLSGVAQGDTAQTRDGNKFKTISLSLKGQAFINGSASATALRVLIIKVKNLNGSAPATLDVFQSNNYLSSFNNVNCPYKFQILYDKYVSLSQDRPTVHVSKYIKQQVHTTFSGTSANTSDCADGHYYLLTMTNESTNTPSFVFNHRLSYVDN